MKMRRKAGVLRWITVTPRPRRWKARYVAISVGSGLLALARWHDALEADTTAGALYCAAFTIIDSFVAVLAARSVSSVFTPDEAIRRSLLDPVPPRLPPTDRG